MSSGYSVLYANKVNDKVWRATDFTPPTSYWIGLFIAAAAATALRANDLVTATEVTGGSYVRMEVRGATGIVWAVSSGGLTQQTGDITWNAATGNWGTVYTVAVLDAASAGNCVMYGDLVTPKAVSTPDVFKIPSTFFQSQL